MTSDHSSHSAPSGKPGDAASEGSRLKAEGRPSIVVAGGGTAGHIEPALAVADAIRELCPNARITALGTSRGLETDVVPARGYDLRLIPPVPVPRKPNRQLVKLPLNVWRAMRKTRDALTSVEADVLIGFGGYVSAPAYLAARSLSLPFFVHEANARAGLANRLGSWLGGTGLNAVENSGIRGDVVGVPIRPIFAERSAEGSQAAAREFFGLDPHKPTLFVTGGSQGAASLNRALAEALEQITASGIQILHAYGKKNSAAGDMPGYTPLPYIADMAKAYRAADLICCRAGAMTVAEVTASGVPAIYVPLPHGNGEQGLNAGTVVDAGAALLIDDREMTGQRMASVVTELMNDDARRHAMACAAQESSMGDAADVIAKRILEAC